MRCTSKRAVCALAALCIVLLTGCGAYTYELPYDPDAQISSYNVISREKPGVANGFSADLCIVTEDIMDDERVDMTDTGAALLCSLSDNEVLYSKNALERMHPASLTKVMTAVVALKYGEPDMMLTATDAVTITEEGATLCGLKPGDTMTLNQALHVLLLNSANDAANLIAVGVAGSVEQFVALMNEEAHALGATNTHFANPHGLTAENHYTTAYDMYLMFREALSYELFQEIINMVSYQTTYYDSKGNPIEKSFQTTNRFLRGDYAAPENVTVLGGKTGTTMAARSCLVLHSKDAAGASYISVILSSPTRDGLYHQMIDLLDEIAN